MRGIEDSVNRNCEPAEGGLATISNLVSLSLPNFLKNLPIEARSEAPIVPFCHCEERSDEEIATPPFGRLAMTKGRSSFYFGINFILNFSPKWALPSASIYNFSSTSLSIGGNEKESSTSLKRGQFWGIGFLAFAPSITK